MTLTIFSLEELWRALFLTVRLSALLLALPFFSTRLLPVALKVICLITLSVSFYPLVQQQPVPTPLGPVHLGLLVVGEFFVGLLIGFVAQLLFVGIQLGGELMNQQMGLGLATILDPQNAQQSSVISNFQYILAVLLFFATHAHHWFIWAMAESLHAIPLLGSTLPTTVLAFLVVTLAKAFVVAVQMAAPILAALLLANVGMGIVARLVPQMNVFILSFPVTIGVGLLMLIGALPYYLGILQRLFGQLQNSMRTIIQLLGGAV
jgi:flagellar biosynthetic protein FliR